MEPRKVLEAVFYVLRTGIQWKALPKTFGAASAIHAYFRLWCEKGFFRALWVAGLAAYDDAQGIDWAWLSGDGCMTKAPLAQETVGKNPTDRGKNGSKRHLLVDGAGVPLSMVATGANRHDVSQLEAALDSIVVQRPDIFERPQHLCLDKGYAGEPALEIVVLRGFIPHIKSRGEEKTEGAHNPEHKARRWVVEVAHSWINRFRKLLVRFEKLTTSYLGLLMFACAFIAFRKADVI
jgi:transposase